MAVLQGQIVKHGLRPIDSESVSTRRARCKRREILARGKRGTATRARSSSPLQGFVWWSNGGATSEILTHTTRGCVTT